MNLEDSDPLLDALLAEQLGEQRPPDLSARILERWAASSASATPVRQVGGARPRLQRDARRRHATYRTWGAALAMTLLGGALIWWAWPANSQRNSPSQIPTVRGGGPIAIVAEKSAAMAGSHGTAANASGDHHPAGEQKQPQPKPSSAPQPAAVVGSETITPPAVGSPAIVPDKNRGIASADTPPTRATAEHAVVDAQVIAFINTGLKENWKEQGLEPAGRATDAEWCRRTMLRLIGRIPTAEEVEGFAADRRMDKRERLVGTLLEGGEYEEEFVGYWAETWTRLLVGRTGGPSPQAARYREGLLAYLREVIHARRPFQEVVAELIAATGSSSRSADDYQGAVNFLLAHAHDQSTSGTARVARLFLGANLQCAQCHAHPTEPQWTQDRFWQLNSFFRQVAVERVADDHWRLVNRDFVGEGRDVDDAEVFFELASGVVRAAYPVFLDGTELPRTGRVSEVDRRRELARLVSQSPDFSRAIMNRLWAHFLGYGFMNPIDDLSPQRPVVLPAVWEQLAKSWSESGYDWRAGLRWIALSDAFALSSRMPSRVAGAGRTTTAAVLSDAPEAGTLPQFTRYYTRPMPIEELYRSLQLLAQARRTNGAATIVTSATRQAWLSQLARRVGPEAVEDDQAIISQVPQSLLQMSDEVTRQAFHGSRDNVLERVLQNQSLSAEQKIEHLFQAALARKPTAQELAGARQLLETTPADSSVALTDLWWALLNSNEFLLDH